MLLPELPSTSLQNALSTVMAFHTAFFSEQRTHFTENKVQHGIHLSYHVFHYPEAADLTEYWNGLLKTQLQHELGGNICRAGQDSPRKLHML